jgi:hypothetical protein
LAMAALDASDFPAVYAGKNQVSIGDHQARGTGRLLLSRGHIRVCSQRGLLQAHRLPLLENHRQLYLTELVVRLIDARATDNY